MKNLQKEIRNGLQAKGMTVKDFIEQLGFTTPAYYRMLRNNSTTNQRLEKINEILGTNFKREKFNSIYDKDPNEDEDKNVNSFDAMLERQRFEWLKEKAEMQYRINVLSETVKSLSLGKQP